MSKAPRRLRGPYRITPEQRAAKAQAEREKQVRRIDRILDRVGPALLIERVVARFGWERPIEEMHALLQPCRCVVEVVVGLYGAEWVRRVLDRIAAPQTVAAE
jgi:hypothetical protein